jgi:putative nucleotidyltransferase with HDIG domain
MVLDIQDRERLETTLIEHLAAEVPVLPGVAQEAMSVASSPDADVRRLAALIEGDQSLAAHLLRTANSALYRPRGPIVSIHQAIVWLGLQALKEITMIVVCRARIFDVPGWESDLADLYEHSLATAMVAREVARIRRSNVEEAFLGGLLHDLGRPVAIQAVVDAGARMKLELTRDEVLGVVERLHPAVGSSIAGKWLLPQAVARAIRDHHDAGATEPLTLVVQVADALADGAQTEMGRRAAAGLNLYAEQVEALEKSAKMIVESIWAAA